MAPYRDVWSSVPSVRLVLGPDLCQAEKISFSPGHALYMRTLHGGKVKNHCIDAGKIARLLRGGRAFFGLSYISSFSSPSNSDPGWSVSIRPGSKGDSERTGASSAIGSVGDSAG